MSYRYRRVDVRKGRLLWAARPVNTSDEGMDLVPVGFADAEVWWHGFTREQAIRRAQRYARRQNRKDDREEGIESFAMRGRDRQVRGAGSDITVAHGTDPNKPRGGCCSTAETQPARLSKPDGPVVSAARGTGGVSTDGSSFVADADDNVARTAAADSVTTRAAPSHMTDLIDRLDRQHDAQLTPQEAQALLAATDGWFSCPVMGAAVKKLKVIAGRA